MLGRRFAPPGMEIALNGCLLSRQRRKTVHSVEPIWHPSAETDATTDESVGRGGYVPSIVFTLSGVIPLTHCKSLRELVFSRHLARSTMMFF